MACRTTGPNAASRCWSARAGDARMPQASASSKPATAPVKRRKLLTAHACFDEVDRLAARKLRALPVPPVAVLEAAGFQPALRDHQPVRNAEELRIGKLDAGPGIAVVIEHLDALGGELTIEAVGNFAYPGGLLQVERHEHHLEGRQRLRPDDAALIVILLDGRGHDARHTDAIAAHEQRHFTARLIEHGRLEGLAVFAPELKDVSDLDTAGDLEAAAAARARIARAHVADIGGNDVAHVPIPIDSREVHVPLVGAGGAVTPHQR